MSDGAGAEVEVSSEGGSDATYETDVTARKPRSCSGLRTPEASLPWVRHGIIWSKSICIYACSVHISRTDE